MLFINYFLNDMFILYDIKTQMDALSAYNKLNLMRDVGFYKTKITLCTLCISVHNTEYKKGITIHQAITAISCESEFPSALVLCCSSAHREIYIVRVKKYYFFRCE